MNVLRAEWEPPDVLCAPTPSAATTVHVMLATPSVLTTIEPALVGDH
jgi:hypothetical protein